MLLPLLMNNVLETGGTPPVDVPASPTPAGRPRRTQRQRLLVQIDGEDFEVGSQTEAEQLLQRARAIAERQAEKRAAVAEGNVARIAKRTGVVQPVKVVAPQIIVSPELELSPLIAEIQRLYEKAGEIAELRLLLAKQMADEDEELLLL